MAAKAKVDPQLSHFLEREFYESLLDRYNNLFFFLIHIMATQLISRLSAVCLERCFNRLGVLLIGVHIYHT